jgi:sulfite reductase alpha subunit-like flavoprotein
LEILPLICGCAVVPPACRAPSMSELQKSTCSLGDPECTFSCGKDQAWCDCTQNAGVAPTWDCVELP